MTNGTEKRAEMTAEAPLLNAHVPASSRVYDELRARIVTMAWPPGTKLSRAELAVAFGVSQSPIREAIQRLEQADLVVSYRQSRTEVTKINQDRLKQEHFLRTGIECEVVNFLARAQDKSILLKAKGILKLQQALVDDRSQIELFRQLDDNFHLELFTAAGQAALHSVVAERSSHMARLRTIDLPRERNLQSVLEGHFAVIKAIEAGDRHAATDAMRAHLSGSIDRLPAIVQENPDYFAR